MTDAPEPAGQDIIGIGRADMHPFDCRQDRMVDLVGQRRKRQTRACRLQFKPYPAAMK